MSRPIKFRGVNVETGTMVYGSLINNMFGKDEFSIPYIIDPAQYIDYCSFEDTEYLAVEVDQETVGQYTGLRDRNGKEIYEGDIVRLTNLSLGQYSQNERYVNDEVVFVHGQFTTRNWNLQQSRCEVIGNIYEHPHLLQEGEGDNEFTQV